MWFLRVQKSLYILWYDSIYPEWDIVFCLVANICRKLPYGGANYKPLWKYSPLFSKKHMNTNIIFMEPHIYLGKEHIFPCKWRLKTQKNAAPFFLGRIQQLPHTSTIIKLLGTGGEVHHYRPGKEKHHEFPNLDFAKAIFKDTLQ